MITEMRAVQADLAARAPFAKDGETIRETRSLVEQIVNPEPERPALHAVQSTAAALAAAEQGGFVEVG